MKTKKTIKALSLLLIFAMLITAFPIGAYAGEYYFNNPRGYIKNLKLTTDMAEICQTGNLARSVDVQIEGTPTEALKHIEVEQYWEEVNDSGENKTIRSDDSFEKGKTYKLVLTLKTYIYNKMDGEFWAFDSKYATIDGVKCTGKLKNQWYSVFDRYWDETDYNNYPNTKLTFEFTFTVDGDYPLGGSVSYKGEARYGETLYATNISAYGNGKQISDYRLKSQWQVEKDGKWEDIPGENLFKIDITGVDKRELVGKNIRVKITTDGYRDAIYGEPKKVEKRDTPSLPAPEAPDITGYNNDDEYAIYINNYNGDEQSYWYTIGSDQGTPINIEGNRFTVKRTNKDQVVTVSTGYKFTEWQNSSNSHSGTQTIVPALITGTSVRTVIFPEYDTTGYNPTSYSPTVYIPIGGQKSIKYIYSPSDATTNKPRWKPVYSGDELLVDVHYGASFGAAPGEEIVTLTAGKTATTVSVIAYQSHNENEYWHYGNDYSAMGRGITVVIYDPNDVSSIPTPNTKKTVNLTKGESYELSTSTLKKYPLVKDGIDAYLNPDNFTYEAAIYKVTNHGYAFVKSNGYVSVENNKNGSITINADEVGSGVVHIFAVSKSNGKKRDIAQITVNVASSGVKISGNVTNFGDSDEGATIQLIKPNGYTVSEQTISGDEAEYTIEDVPDGDYVLVAKKKGCATRSLEIKVKNGNVTQDLELSLYGDVNGDGKLTPSDVVQLRRYFANYDSDTETSTIEVSAGADVNGDGTLTPSDVVLLRRYFANYNSETGTSTIELGPQ